MADCIYFKKKNLKNTDQLDPTRNPTQPTTCLTRNPIDPFKNDPFWPATRLTRKPDWPDPPVLPRLHVILVLALQHMLRSLCLKNINEKKTLLSFHINSLLTRAYTVFFFMNYTLNLFDGHACIIYPIWFSLNFVFLSWYI